MPIYYNCPDYDNSSENRLLRYKHQVRFYRTLAIFWGISALCFGIVDIIFLFF